MTRSLQFKISSALFLVGAVLISIGLAVSLLGALLSWALLCAEILFVSAKDGTMPAFPGLG